MPDAPIGIRVDPVWMSQVTGWKIDHGWAQYVTRKGDQKTWYDEVAAAANGDPLAFEPAEVLERVTRLGDLFANTLTLKQRLPKPASS